MQSLNLLIIYYSRNGATRQLVELIAEGVETIPQASAILELFQQSQPFVKLPKVRFQQLVHPTSSKPTLPIATD